jgi:hypothetical protein
MLLQSLAERLRADPRFNNAMPRKVIGDIAVALRAYASFVAGGNGPAATTGPLADPDRIRTELRTLGFGATAAGPGGFIEFERNGLILYSQPDDRINLIVHPVFEAFYSTLAPIAGALNPPEISFCNNAAMAGFPSGTLGHDAAHYGIKFRFADPGTVRAFIEELQSLADSASPISPERTIGEDAREAETEATVLAKARIGQGRFRADLLCLWQGHCALTGVAVPELLRASHIKAWRVSSNRERLDAFNGLLLAVHLDALFDRALISFSDTGALLVSRRLPARERAVFGLAQDRSLLLTAAHLPFLRHHRAAFEAQDRLS